MESEAILDLEDFGRDCASDNRGKGTDWMLDRAC